MKPSEGGAGVRMMEAGRVRKLPLEGITPEADRYLGAGQEKKRGGYRRR